MELLRLAGAPGVGKSTTAWAIARRLAGDGVATGYVDTDQLGMRYPAPDDDPDRWALKERALVAVAGEFARAGVARLVVSGVAWPDDPPPQVPGATARSVWLDASEQTRRARLAVRGMSDESLARTLAAGSAEVGRVHPAWERLDTDGRTVGETVEDVIARWRPVEASKRAVGASPRARRDARTPDRVLWITGPRLAGSSVIGWNAVDREWRAGRAAGFADLAQLSFAWNAQRTVGLRNLARLHETFHSVQTDTFVVVAPIDIEPDAVRAALPHSDVSFIRVVVAADEVRRHVAARREGAGPMLAGDDIRTATDSELERVVQTAVAQSLVQAREGELLVDVRGLSVEVAATAVRHVAGW